MRHRFTSSFHVANLAYIIFQNKNAGIFLLNFTANRGLEIDFCLAPSFLFVFK